MNLSTSGRDLQIDQNIKLKRSKFVSTVQKRIKQENGYCWTELGYFTIFDIYKNGPYITVSKLESLIQEHAFRHGVQVKVIDCSFIKVSPGCFHVKKTYTEKNRIPGSLTIGEVFNNKEYSEWRVGSMGDSKYQSSMVNVARKLMEEFKESSIGKNLYMSEVNSRFNQNLKDSTITFPYHTSKQRFDLFNTIFHGRLVPIPNKDNDHAGAKFIDQYYKLSIARKLLKRETVVFVGAKLKEVIDICCVKPNIRPIVIFGELNGEDTVRNIENLRFAERLLEKDTDTKYAPFDGIDPSLVKPYSDIPARIKILLYEFIKYCSGESNSIFFNKDSIRGMKLPTADVMVATNSIYDISPLQLSYYMKKFKVKMCLATRIACTDLFKMGYSYNDLLGVRFENLGKTKTGMSFTEGQSKGYVHETKNLEEWNCYTKFKTPNGLLFYEIEDSRLCYEMLVIHLVKCNDFDRYMSKSVTNSSYVRLVKIESFLRYNKIEFFYVDRLKFSRIKDYCLRISMDSFEPAKITTMATALKNSIIVGDMEIQMAWDIDETIFHETIKFLIVYTSLLRGEFLNLVVDSISMSKENKYKHFFPTYFYNYFKDMVTFKGSNWLIREELDKLLALPQLFIWEKNQSMSFERIISFLFKKNPTLIDQFPLSATQQNELMAREQISEVANRKYYFGVGKKIVKYSALASTVGVWAPWYLSYKMFNKYCFNIPEKYHYLFEKMDEYTCKLMDKCYEIIEMILIFFGVLEDIDDMGSNPEIGEDDRIITWINTIDVEESELSTSILETLSSYSDSNNNSSTSENSLENSNSVSSNSKSTDSSTSGESGSGILKSAADSWETNSEKERRIEKNKSFKGLQKENYENKLVGNFLNNIKNQEKKNLNKWKESCTRCKSVGPKHTIFCDTPDALKDPDNRCSKNYNGMSESSRHSTQWGQKNKGKGTQRKQNYRRNKRNFNVSFQDEKTKSMLNPNVPLNI